MSDATEPAEAPHEWGVYTVYDDGSCGRLTACNNRGQAETCIAIWASGHGFGTHRLVSLRDAREAEAAHQAEKRAMLKAIDEAIFGVLADLRSEAIASGVPIERWRDEEADVVVPIRRAAEAAKRAAAPFLDAREAEAEAAHQAEKRAMVAGIVAAIDAEISATTGIYDGQVAIGLRKAEYIAERVAAPFLAPRKPRMTVARLIAEADHVPDDIRAAFGEITAALEGDAPA